MICPRVSRGIRMRLVLVVLVCLVLVATAPGLAIAREYGVGPVDIEATVAADGSLEVHERRTYDFDGSFGGIYWDVPRASYEGRDVGVELLGVYLVKGDNLYYFEEATDGEGGSYEVSEEEDCLRLKLYWPAEDERVTFQVNYRTGPLATRWSDTAELYWKYVPADEESEVEWQNVTATVHLPVPGGEPVNPGKNVRAWAHGPLDGDVSFAGSDVVCTSPGVGAAELLEVRIVFPPSWLPEAEVQDEARLEAILEEEAAWAEEANAVRRHARGWAYGVPGFMVLVAVASVVAAKLHKRFRRALTPKASFAGKYFREVPTDDHPAVLGMLYHDGQLDGQAFAATLMRLADQGKVSLDSVETEERGKFGRKKRVRQWRMVLHGSVPGARSRRNAGEGKRIDNAALRFLREVLARTPDETADAQLGGPAGDPYVLMSFFGDVASEHPSSYERGYNWWADAVRAAYDKREFARKLDDSILVGAIGLGDFALFVILGFVGMFVGSPTWLLGGALILLFAAGVYVILTDDDAPRIAFTQEAAEIKAKLKALARWLCDFTRLEEAVPTDVALWNELLEMATVLGVADKVVEQLRTAAPQVVADPGFSAYAWYDREDEDDSLPLPATLLADSVAKGHSTSSGSLQHSLSSSDVVSSHDSSSGGSGGGFSSGGGGGYSGGGRGGAF